MKTLYLLIISLSAAALAEPVNFTWRDNSDNETGFIFEVRPLGSSEWIESGRTAADVSSYTLADAELYAEARVWAYIADPWTGGELRSANPATNLRGEVPQDPDNLQPIQVVTTSRTESTTTTYYAQTAQ